MRWVIGKDQRIGNAHLRVPGRVTHLCGTKSKGRRFLDATDEWPKCERCKGKTKGGEMTIQERIFEALKRNAGVTMQLNDIVLATGLSKSQVQGALYHLGASEHNVADNPAPGLWRWNGKEFASKPSGVPAKAVAIAITAPPSQVEGGDVFEVVGLTASGRTVVRSIDSQVIYLLEPLTI